MILILVDNAVKYTQDKGKVTVRIQEDKGAVQLSVSDTGIGIAPEHQERIFDRFYRVDKVRSRRMGGNGLGLAIAREFVEAHGGTISVESETGKGTTFRVQLKARVKS